MSETLYVQAAEGLRTDELDVELVERKGLGHPDTICDLVMEHVSQALSRAYLEQAGAILHHNCDKALLAAGRVERRWGGGRVLEPMRLVMGDRATSAWDGRRLDVPAIAVDAARDWLRTHLRHVDPDRHVCYQVEMRPGSAELTALFGQPGTPGANDTSAAVGYAPLTDTERTVLATERFLNSPGFRRRFPQTGEDVKVMGIRTRRQLDLTVAMPLLDRHVGDEAGYFRLKDEVRDALLAHLHDRPTPFEGIAVRLNPLDRPGHGLHGVYLSVLGTSAEDADSGEVGRGNRANGLISFCRPGGAEAAAGKNPVSHVGKIYSRLAFRMAERLVAGVPRLAEATVWLCSRVGEPVDCPARAFVLARPAQGARLGDLEPGIRGLVADELAGVPALCRALVTDREWLNPSAAPPEATPASHGDGEGRGARP